MIDYTSTYEIIENTPLKTWVDRLSSDVNETIESSNHGDLPKWLDILRNLPDIKPSVIKLNSDSICVGQAQDCSSDDRQKLELDLRQFHPWRKGPYDIFGIHIETEWRSDMKWNRLKDHIRSLENRMVLDVGCGSGYHCWRMAGAGAKIVLGIDPTLLYVMQFQAMQSYIHNPTVSVLPLGVDDIPLSLNHFDTIFSMGIIYHRHSPIDHLIHLRSLLRDGGELVLETLVIDGKQGEVLKPKGRYAKMPNVRAIPAPGTVEAWLNCCGFHDARLIDTTQTTDEEQRVTEWMGFESLSDFLDPKDSTKTVEGYPAPKRAIFLASN